MNYFQAICTFINEFGDKLRIIGSTKANSSPLRILYGRDVNNFSPVGKSRKQMMRESLFCPTNVCIFAIILRPTITITR
jgi:hypothetical protein